MTIRWDDYEDAGVPQPDVLQPETVDRVLERVVGKTISRLEEFADANPRGGAAVGFILRSHERPLYWAFPVPERFSAVGFCAVWCPNWFPPQMIVTRSMERMVTSERAGAQYTRRLAAKWYPAGTRAPVLSKGLLSSTRQAPTAACTAAPTATRA